MDRLCYWLQHEEWWLQKAALTALTGLVTDERFYQKLLPLIGKLMADNRNNVMMWTLWGVAGKLREAAPAVQALACRVARASLCGYPGETDGSRRLGSAERGSSLVGNWLPLWPNIRAGWTSSYELAGKRYPDQTLPHKDLFMNADTTKLGPELKKKVSAIIRDQFIPEYVANNIVPLLAEVRPEPVVANPEQFSQGGRAGRALRQDGGERVRLAWFRSGLE